MAEEDSVPLITKFEHNFRSLHYDEDGCMDGIEQPPSSTTHENPPSSHQSWPSSKCFQNRGINYSNFI